MDSLFLIYALLLVSGAFCGVVKKDIKGKFLEEPVVKPEIVGNHGAIVEIDGKPASGKNKMTGEKDDINNILGKILETVNSDKRVVSDAGNTDKLEKKQSNDAKPGKLTFAQLEGELDNLISKMSDQTNTQRSMEEKTASNDMNKYKFKDFADVKEDKSSEENKFMSYEDFRDTFYKMFFDKNNRDSTSSDKQASALRDVSNKRSTKLSSDLTDVYNELKAETKREAERKMSERKYKIARLQKDIDMDLKREEAKEAKKREIVDLLNKILGGDNLVYQDGRVKMAEKNNAEEQYHPNSAEQDFKKLFHNVETNTIQDSNGVAERFPRIDLDFEKSEQAKKKELNDILTNLAAVLKPRDENNEKTANTYVDNVVDDPPETRHFSKSLPLPESARFDNVNDDADKERSLKDVLININDVLTSLVRKKESSENELRSYEEVTEKRSDEGNDTNKKLNGLLLELKRAMSKSLNGQASNKRDNEMQRNSSPHSGPKEDKDFLEALKGFRMAANKDEGTL